MEPASKYWCGWTKVSALHTASLEQDAAPGDMQSCSTYTSKGFSDRVPEYESSISLPAFVPLSGATLLSVPYLLGERKRCLSTLSLHERASGVSILVKDVPLILNPPFLVYIINRLPHSLLCFFHHFPFNLNKDYICN